MTSTVSELTTAVYAANTYDAVTTTIGLFAVLLALALLVVKELIRAAEWPDSGEWLSTFNIAALPLLMAVAVIIGGRLFSLL